MKRRRILLMIMAILLFTTACAKSLEEQIQEQLDLGNRFLTEGQYEEAVVAFQKAIELDEKNVEAYRGLAHTHENQAETVFAENIQEGLTYYDLAVQAYTTLLELVPADEDAVDSLLYIGDVYLDEEQYEEAQVIFEMMRETKGNKTEILERLLIVYKELEDREKQLQILCLLNPDSTNTEEEIQAYVEMIDQIQIYLEAEDYESLFTLMEGEQFQNFQQIFEGQDSLLFAEEEGKGLGFYPGGYIYYGDYVEDVRQGEGSWMHARNDWRYLGYGSWDHDLPNGRFTEHYQFDEPGIWQESGQNTGEVEDGLWNGLVQHDAHAYDVGEDTYHDENIQVSFTDGKYNILRTEIDAATGEMVYIIYEGENGVSQALSQEYLDMHTLHGITGTDQDLHYLTVQ